MRQSLFQKGSGKIKVSFFVFKGATLIKAPLRGCRNSQLIYSIMMIEATKGSI